MPSDALVSVIIPSYNHERLVIDALNSVAEQTHAELELVVVDDASTDRTAAVVERVTGAPSFRQRFRDRIRLERNAANLGAHATLNRGITVSTGDFVAILNSDDRYAPDRIRTVLDALSARGREIAFTGVRTIDEQGRDATTSDAFSASLSEMQRLVPEHPSVGFALLERNVAISTGNLVFRRSLFERISGFRPLAYCHDWDFILRCVLETEPLFIPETLYEYRVHPTNSFRALAAVKDREAAAVLRRYFTSVRRGTFSNGMAPAPNTWPGVFECALSSYGLERVWTRTCKSPE